jgi:asparagine synthase (glutamine-hydrolysing)
MCGIAGVIGQFSGLEAQGMVQSMVSALAHRGPDDRGINSWTAGRNVVCFGHTRLSILDLSAAGHQPMTEPSGRYWTVFNGEIYNLPELHQLLDPERRLFRTSSDTEAILHAYDRWSLGAFQRFRGMFAFALLDTHARQVHLVRDPLGIKPLYYHASANGLLFASEVRALLATGHVPRRLDCDSVPHFLSCGWVGKESSAVADIRLLQPGQVLTVDFSGDRIQWRTATYESVFDVPQEGVLRDDRDECAGHMRHLLEQSVKAHLQSDVPVGLFLSGGIDSTALLHLMREAGREPPKTFTVVFSEAAFSEQKIARQVAQHYGAEHHELNLSELDLLNELPNALAAMDQPTMDGVNTFVVAKAAAATGLKVALSGLGSDELFAGYQSFRRVRWARMVAGVPLPVRAAVAGCGRRMMNRPPYDKVWDLATSPCTPGATYFISRQLFGSSEIAKLMLRGWAPNEETNSDLSADDINEISRLEMSGYMTGLLLRDTDSMSMASSLEVRVPFVDKMVVRHALRLPGSWKVASSKPKVFLLESMRGAIPAYVWDRPKMGFVFPFDRWMRSSLRDQVETTLDNSQLAESVGLRPKAVLAVWNSFLKGFVKFSKPWSLFVLLRWCERHGVSI